MYLLDTNTCIKYLNGLSKIFCERLESHSPNDIVLCSVVKAELFYGSMKSKYPEKNLALQKQFAERFVSLPFDDNCAESYSVIRADLEKSGTPIGPNDLLIASIAVANKTILITHNVREFSRVKALQIEDWES